MSIKAFKGFEKNMKCRGFQYEPGKSYSTDKTPIRCTENGFHSCENPIDIFKYYAPGLSKFYEVIADGEISKYTDDTKMASQKISIGAEISLHSMIDFGIKFFFSKLDWSKKENHATGDRSASSATGDSSASSATGYRSASLSTGTDSSSQIINSDKIISANSTAIALGINGKASASINCWIVLAEWSQDEKENWNIKSVKTAKVDGVEIKANTWYKLTNGKFEIAE
jgi:hypothetical protein